MLCYMKKIQNLFIYSLLAICLLAGCKGTNEQHDDGDITIERFEQTLFDTPADQLQQAINEIWARNGYIFKSDYWNEYYSQFDWYHGTIPADQFDAASNLNEIERDNCDRLAARRAQIGG